MGNIILRVRNLRTNFYTYAGVVKALDGVSFDVREGETLGLVGETGCGKSVTALSILRLIPVPPGKVEEGEALFDVPEDVIAKIEHLEGRIRELLPGVFGDAPEAKPPDLSSRRLRTLWKLAGKAEGARSTVEEFRGLGVSLVKLKEPYDLLQKPDPEIRKIRGNKIAMIFQEPTQALNPVFPIGDQIAENILLHQREAVVKGLAEKMDLEAERDALGKDLSRLDRGGASAPVPLPKAPPRPRTNLLLGLAWIGFSLVLGFSYSMFLATLLTAGLPGLDAPQVKTISIGFGFALLLAAGAIVSSVGFLQSSPWTRQAGGAVAVLEVLSRLFLITLPLGTPFRVLVALALAMDVLVLHEFTKPGVAAAMTGRRSGWEALLHDAEGDVDKLTDVRDLVAGSRWDEATRAKMVEKLDHLTGRAREVLEADEPISGRFYPLLPRRFQLKYHRGVQGRPGRDFVRSWSELPVVGGLFAFLLRPFTIPLQNEAARSAIIMLRRVKISDPERIASHFPYELSGGMQQRALIAIALSCNPRLLIADEPTTALDVTIQAQILELIKEMKATFGSTVLIITHDLGIIAEMCNRVCVMYAGLVVEDAAVRAVFKSPHHPYTQGLMKAIPTYGVRKERLEIIRGSVPNLITPPPGCRFHPRCPQVMATCGWSPQEVGDRLREVIRGQGWPIDADGISWRAAGATELRISFPEGVEPQAADWIRRAVELGRPQPAIAAVTAVEPAGPEAAGEKEPYDVVVRILAPRKPPPFDVGPGHTAACFLYEEPMVVPLVEAGRRDG